MTRQWWHGPIIWAVGGVIAVAGVALLDGCALFGAAERADLSNHMNKLEQCQELGRQAPDGGHIAAYDACKKEAGI